MSDKQADDYLERILNAQVYDVAEETPLDFAPNLSARIHNSIYFKREDMQPVFSFKIRGAYNKMAKLSPQALKRGVICASAGNHAQGVALSAKYLGVRAVIVMPTTTPQIKIDAVQSRGGEVVLAGESYSDAYAHAVELEKAEKLTFVHPYDDPDVIAGQGTIAMEILRQHPKPLHAVFCCVGGGGLLAGVAAYIKRVRPDVRIIGVEAVDACAMTSRWRRASASSSSRSACSPTARRSSWWARKPSASASSMWTRWCWSTTTRSARRSRTSSRIPAPSSSPPARWRWPAPGGVKRNKVRDKTLVAVASGANMNFDRLRFVAERAELGEQREAVLAVTIPEKPGSFKKFCSVLGNRNITEFNYRYASKDVAHIFAGVSVHNRTEATRLVEMLERHELPALDLTDDEMAKSHIRYMVGGHAPQAENEVLYRFIFPERPGHS